MATEQYANNAQSTLSGTITSGASSLTLADGSAFPTAGNFNVVVDSEIIAVSARSGNTLTLATRGAEGTTAASHTSGATVTQVLTRSGLLNVGQNLLLSDSYAALPSSSIVRLFLPTDGISLLRDNSTAWVPWGPVFPFVTLDNSLYSWVNQGSATVTAVNGGIFLQSPANGASDSLHLRVKSVPASPYTVTMAFLPQVVFPGDFVSVGMALRNSGSGSLVTFHVVADSTHSTVSLVFASAKWTNATTFSANYTLSPSNPITAPFQAGSCMWMRITDDNTNRKFSVSNDGTNFVQLFSIGRTDFITPDQIGYYVNPNNATLGAGINILSFTGG